MNDKLLTVACLATANTLTSAIINNVMGNDIANTFGGQVINDEVITSLTQNKINNCLTESLGV